MFKSLGRSPAVQGAASALAARYLRLVERTTRFQIEPEDFATRVLASAPVIAALWHGQHTMAHLAWPPGLQVAALISRNADAEINARVLEKFGVIPVRGSGGRAEKMHRRGGVTALREILRLLDDGVSIVMTADVPKIARVAGDGVIHLARRSGRPIYPLAVVSSARKDFKSWDRASFPLPFGRGAIVVGEALFIAADADEAAMEAARQKLEQRLDAAHERAYGLVGAKDPGADLSRQRDMRA
ncbi:MAG: DUF374 domain-containing protein [Alphaproteobacteria bacterium]|nr:DUF374 domain-containing protein [Alphaproteobacteria bacterium]